MVRTVTLHMVQIGRHVYLPDLVRMIRSLDLFFKGFQMQYTEAENGKGYGSVVTHLLFLQKVPGSIPRSSMKKMW